MTPRISQAKASTHRGSATSAAAVCRITGVHDFPLKTYIGGREHRWVSTYKLFRQFDEAFERFRWRRVIAGTWHFL